MSRAAATAQACALLAGAGVICMVLAGLGPWLDAQPDRRAEAQQADEEQALQRLGERYEREAREECTRRGSENSAYIRKAWGGIVCTTKHGRKLAQKGAQ